MWPENLTRRREEDVLPEASWYKERITRSTPIREKYSSPLVCFKKGMISVCHRLIHFGLNYVVCDGELSKWEQWTVEISYWALSETRSGKKILSFEAITLESQGQDLGRRIWRTTARSSRAEYVIIVGKALMNKRSCYVLSGCWIILSHSCVKKWSPFTKEQGTRG